MAERCDFYSDEEYQQYLAFEEEHYKEEQAKKEYEEELSKRLETIKYYSKNMPQEIYEESDLLF